MTTATMPFFTVDTLQFSNRLQKAGLERKIADEVAEAIKDTQTQTTEGLATKHDILLLKNELDAFRQVTEQKFESLEHKLTIKMFMMLIAAVSLVTWLDRIIN